MTTFNDIYHNMVEFSAFLGDPFYPFKFDAVETSINCYARIRMNF